MKKPKIERIQWVDVARGLAIIFVYLGHWPTNYLQAFAYFFTLQTFFFLGGALGCSRDKSFKDFVIKLGIHVFIPYLIWSTIAFIFTSLEGDGMSATSVWNFVLYPNSTMSNYWFFPAFIACQLAYFSLRKIIKSDYLILVFAFILNIFLGERGLFGIYVIEYVNNSPILDVLFHYVKLNSIFTYLFWSALGGVCLNKLNTIRKYRKKKPAIFHSLGIAACFLSAVAVTDLVIKIPIVNTLYENNKLFSASMFLVHSIIVCFFIYYISVLMEESKVLNTIGKRTMCFFGLEFFTHNLVPVKICRMIGTNDLIINSTISVIIVELIHLLINYLISIPLVKYFPIMNGTLKKKD